MPDLSVASLVLVIVVAAFTAAAAIWDIRERRIPNKLTLPVFFAGWIYQAVFHGWSGLGDGGLGFLVGFGVLFALWMVGGGGGGDVKLMGALSVWIGFQLTLLVMIISTFLVLAVTVGVVLWSVLSRGVKGSQKKYLATGKPVAKGKPRPRETVAEKQGRRVMAYAVPVAVSTWLVMIWKLPTLP
ncbi:Type IV leader peptidase family protein [Maioricimonas rarisocia]|uniref:Type IV leader peptidase family protein n=1 Tax=Maioricimonas rarisocia TaxID=2528026 RepID=A0A517ZFU3_9PLAN|nr:A24 family peptidase [Maioricimonas rarisocia]QDU41345.1 Type IV leader peptidase family protein [Maioricimonas rarisocia]